MERGIKDICKALPARETFCGTDPTSSRCMLLLKRSLPLTPRSILLPILARNKTAMDVGCGTGLLAMMMIRDGEVELVHAVEVGTALSLSFNSLLPGWHHGDGGLDRTPAP